MKLLIDVQGNKPLSAYGDNHIIAYNSESKNYYVTTAESFFAGQNAKIKKMLENYEETTRRMVSFQQELALFESSLQGRVNAFEGNINQRFDEFLRQYQETNARLIAMVRELVEVNNSEEE